MKKVVTTVFIFIGVWFVASVLNGILCGISISVFDSGSFIDATEKVMLSFTCSFLFSIPLVGLVWLVTVIAQATGKSGHDLFQVVLTVTFICGLMGALFFITAMGDEFKDARFVAGLCIIISAMGGVMVFRKQLKAED